MLGGGTEENGYGSS